MGYKCLGASPDYFLQEIFVQGIPFYTKHFQLKKITNLVWERGDFVMEQKQRRQIDQHTDLFRYLHELII